MTVNWADLEEEVIRCTKCGACQQVCPIFRELGTEASVARGKINLVKAAVRGELDPSTGRFAERMSWCLSCKACYENCPRGVRFDQLLVAVRSKLVDASGLPWTKRLIFRLGLRYRRLFNASLHVGSLGQWLLFRPGPDGQGMLPRLPMGLDLRRMVTPLAARPFRERHPETIPAPQAKYKVAFFTGCMINYVYPEIGDAVLKVLERNHVSVVIPSAQHCCGTPVYVNGDRATAIELAKAVVDIFAALEVDFVITACGSCGASLRSEYPEMLKDVSGYSQKAAELARKTIDFSELLVKIGLNGEMSTLARNVTYHDSCHLARGQKVKSQPRELIRNLPGVTFTEMQQPGRCCGGAGSFSLQHYDLAMKISQRKVDDIRATNSDTLVIGCPMCIMHMQDGLHQNGMNTNVVHTAELIAAAYEK